MPKFPQYEIDFALSSGTRGVVAFNYIPASKGTGMGYSGASPGSPDEIDIEAVLDDEGWDIDLTDDEYKELVRFCFRHVKEN
jgi:hypothetical protein